MNQAHGGPGWYLHRNGETAGPYDDGTIIGWIRGGMTDGMIRWGAADPTSPWLPLNSHSPFAQALGYVAAPSPKKSGLGAKEAGILLVVGVVSVGAYAAFSWNSDGAQGSTLASLVDPTCTRLADSMVDISVRGIAGEDELKKPPKQVHFTAVQLRQMRDDYMAECKALQPEVLKCAELAKTLVDYEICKRSDGECSRATRKPNGLCP